MQLILALFSKYTSQYEFPAKNGQIQIPTYNPAQYNTSKRFLK